MAETSAIEWTDATVNFWWGCTKVGPGCDHCYAETWSKRTGGDHWGMGTPRRQIASAAATLAKLNRQDGKRVFIQSMSDLFDNEVPEGWFVDAWAEIWKAKNCRIQIVTKRISAVEKRLAKVGPTIWPRHAGLMITVVNQAEADRDIPRLLALKAKLGIPWVGLSMEPLLGPVNLTEITRPAGTGEHVFSALECDVDPEDDEWRGACLDWVIVGGESGPKARPMHPDWARSIRDQCQAAGVPFHFKQWGEWVQASRDVCPDSSMTRNKAVWLGWDGTQAKPSHLGLDRPIGVIRIGKARAGRLLDGREWNEMPRAL